MKLTLVWADIEVFLNLETSLYAPVERAYGHVRSIKIQLGQWVPHQKADSYL